MTTVETANVGVSKQKTLTSKAWRRRNLTKDKVSFFLVFLILPVACYLTFVVSPFLQAAYYSLTNWSGFSPEMKFIALDNYQKLFNDAIFLTSLKNSVIFAAILPIVTMALALVFASLITVGGPSHGNIKGLRYSSFYRVVSFFPYVIPAIVIGLIWAQVYDPSAGLFNGFLSGIGLDRFANFAWLGNVATARPAVMFVVVWGLVGFYMVLFIAAIKGVPGEIFEAARIDGAGRFRTIVSITLPLIRENVQTSMIYMGIVALDLYVYMAALEPGGGPANSTLVISQQLFTTAFTRGQFGYACAMGVLLAAITLVYAGLVFGINRLTGGRNEVGE